MKVVANQSDEALCSGLEAELEEVERKLRLELMEVDLRLAQQRVRLAPWWMVVRCMMVLAAVLWVAVFVAAVKRGH